jgi:hypothetical protein
VELDELHVDERRAGAQGERVAVAGVLPRVARDLERLADAAGREDHGGRLERGEPAVLAEVAEDAGHRLPVLQHVGDGELVEHLQVLLAVAELALVVLLQRDDLLLHGADQLETGAVADVRQPRVLVPAEVALADLAVLGAVEERAVGLQLPDAVRGLLGVQLGHARVVEELAAAHRVAEVDLPVVLGVHVAHRGGGTALGHHRVRLAEQRLREDRRPHALLAGLDRRAQTGAAGTDHDDVELVALDVRRRAVCRCCRHLTTSPGACWRRRRRRWKGS